MKIVMLDAHTANPGDVSWAPFESIAPCERHPRTHVAETAARCAGAPIVITNKAPMTRETIEALPDLKYIGVIATGFNIVDTVAAKERGVIVTNVPGYGTPAVAQHVFALILELANNVGASAQSVAAGGWQNCLDFCYYDKPIIELAGRTLGIIGYGEIGAAVARIGQAFGMKVLAWSTNLTEERAAEIGATRVDKATLLREADVVTLHLILSDRSRNTITAPDLALMKPTSFIVNTSRGPLIEQAALIAALKEGRIAGAGLDVFDIEPMPADHPILSAPNTVLTPHLGYVTEQNYRTYYEVAVAATNAFLAGAPIGVIKP